VQKNSPIEVISNTRGACAVNAKLTDESPYLQYFQGLTAIPRFPAGRPDKTLVRSAADRVYSVRHRSMLMCHSMRGASTAAFGGGFLVSHQTGLITDRFFTLGINWSAVYLLDNETPLLFESGFACMAKLYEEAIRSVLGARRPVYLFLTHSHWDHCGSAGYLKKAFPGLKVGASHRAAQVLKRPHALELIAKLSEEVLPQVARVPGIDAAQLLEHAFQPFDVDMPLADGQVIELEPGLTVRVIATPGHTRDHLSYYIPEKKILVATEASGALDRAGTLVTEFLVDYDAYVSSLKKLAALPVEVLCQGHHYVFVGKDEVERFFARSLEAAKRFKEWVYEMLDEEEGSVERVVQRIKAEQWDTNTQVKQTEGAYLLNVRARISHLAEKHKREK
jgi:2-aminobenzoylacetyl-CoA thioesterase